MPPHVPKGHARSKLTRDGYVKQISFRRSMSIDEVCKTIVAEFSNISGIESAQFLCCEPSNVLCLSKTQELDGDGVIELAGQGSLYLTLKPVKVCSCIHICISGCVMMSDMFLTQKPEALLAEDTNLISILKVNNAANYAC